MLFRSGTSSYSKLSICSFSASDILSKADRLGISLGATDEQKNLSILGLLHTENSRSLSFLKNNMNIATEDQSNNLVLKRASNLSKI